MTDSSDSSTKDHAQALVDDPAHYIDSVSAMADSSELSAAEDIVSSSGMKLVARGARINAGLREKLRGHGVSGKVLEQSLSITGGVTPESLAIEMRNLFQEDTWLKRLETKSGDPGAMRYGVSYLKLPREILFRLTVARDQRPELYHHSNSVAVISHYLALRLHLRQSTINNVLVGALCHDLGELYIDPAILKPGRVVTGEERRFIYAHPVAGWLMVRDLAGVDSEAAGAIIEHHERLDGSGYPQGKKADAIGLPGRILAAAEVSASIMARFGDHRRLSTLLRLSNEKYDPKVASLLHDALIADAPPTIELGHDTFAKNLAGFAAVLDAWTRLRSVATLAQSVPGEFLSERMLNLRAVVLRFGFDPDGLDMLVKLAEEDATIAAELTAVAAELQFQLADLGREFDRRSPDWQKSVDQQTLTALSEWRRQLQDSIDGW